MSGAFGIAQNSEGKGLLARDLRKIIEGSYTSPGIIKGGEISGNQNLTYHVGETVGLVSRGAADGMSMFYLSPTDTPSVSAGSTLPRIDTIWVKALDPELDNDQYGVQVGVTSGTPSQNPLPAKLDPSVTRLMDMLVQANTTNLATGAVQNGSYDFAVPYGSSLGMLAQTEDTRTNVDGDPSIRKFHYELDTKFYVPTDRYVEFIYDGDVAYFGAALNEAMSWASEFDLDKQQVLYSARETIIAFGFWTHVRNDKIIKVSQGTHLVRIKNGIAYKQGNGYPHFHYGTDNGLSYPGRRLQVWDRGVAG